MPTTPPFLWHHRTHQAWAEDQLVFIFLAYEPTYNRDDAVTRLEAFLAEREVRSYQLYEVTAPYDLLVRAWIPKRISVYEFQDDLSASHPELRVPHLLPVVEIVHHWPWASSEQARIGEMDMPKENVIKAGRPARERELINAVQRDGGAPLGKHRVLIDEAKAHEIIRKPKYRPGIRFLVRVKVGEAQVANHRALRLHICRLLDAARHIVERPSVYRLAGTEQFLIFGQVPPTLKNFHAISQVLVSPINDSASTGDARTYTSFFATPGFLAFRDELRIPVHELGRSKLELNEIMSQPEGHHLEIKGSAFTDLDDWTRGGKEPIPSRKPTKDAETFAVNMLMRAIASLLNSDGGHIVVGALEDAHYGECERFQALPTADPEGTHRYIGLPFDCPKGEWDKFARKVRSVIDARFEPVPSPEVVKIYREKVDELDICVIEVLLPDEFFWVWVSEKVSNDEKTEKQARAQLKKQFVVRKDGSTEILTDSAVERYQRSTRRAQRVVAP